NMIMDGTLTLGELAAFIGYLSMLIWPMIAFGWIVSIVQQAAASMDRLLKIMREDIEKYESESDVNQIEELKGKIQFNKVSFSYNNENNFVLKNINLEIPSGSTVAFIGRTGEGKSTLVNLISRLYETTKGEILIDDIIIKNIPLKILRRDIAVVPQESFLFSDSLKDNIFYGVQKKTIELDELSRLSCLDQDLNDFPNGFETIIGERGITLSGGQKQRVCLARALATDPSVLVLDDSFSSVDTHTEEEILNNLKNYIKNRTTIIISHRISTVKNADKIFVIDGGKIIEEGTHKELLRQKGLYAQLHKKQLLEEEIKEIV
ncbi:MAG: ABC transporter ATP-binding protein, partial [Ignavibacteriales bacterium]|nr:ABC transporter ATP-binding protein [Ignavibacteriales bacterium]